MTSVLRDEFNYRFPIREEDYDPDVGYCNSFSADYSEESFSTENLQELKKIEEILKEEANLDTNFSYPLTKNMNMSDIPEIRALRLKIQKLENLSLFNETGPMELNDTQVNNGTIPDES
jgi:hypothetical protein